MKQIQRPRNFKNSSPMELVQEKICRSPMFAESNNFPPSPSLDSTISNYLEAETHPGLPRPWQQVQMIQSPMFLKSNRTRYFIYPPSEGN